MDYILMSKWHTKGHTFSSAAFRYQ